MEIYLPISKSIANRLLVCKAMRGEDLCEVVLSPAFVQCPDDVRMLTGHLIRLQEEKRVREAQGTSYKVHLNCGNAGTALRFLTAYAAQQEGCEVELDGNERMRERPIGQLVDALRELGADIEYLGTHGFPPLLVRGRRLQQREQPANEGQKPQRIRIAEPLSTQFVSALMLIGVEVQTEVDSPYIQLTKEVIQRVETGELTRLEDVESDWSSIAFWLERQALGLAPHEGYTFPGLRHDSLQGDKVALSLFQSITDRTIKEWDFSACPDLYPAAAVACHLLGLRPHFTGLQSLRIKESDRIAAVEANLREIDAWKQEHGQQEMPHAVSSFGDHRIAMAFLAAGYRVDDLACISKSYPAFFSQLKGVTRVVAEKQGEIVPHMHDGILGVYESDEGLGKKHALQEAMPTVSTEYAWLTDVDVTSPLYVQLPAYSARTNSIVDDPQVGGSIAEGCGGKHPDMVILPLIMVKDGHATLIEKLQCLEYDAIQGLTMLAAQRGHAVMCAGANLLVQCNAWLECADELHEDVLSGDDMFMLEAMKRRGMLITYGKPVHAAMVSPIKGLRALLKQRMRWAGKAGLYRDKDILCCGAWTVLSNLFTVVLPGWALVKWLLDMWVVWKYRSFIYSRKRDLLNWEDWAVGLLLTLVYPWYMALCLLGGRCRRHKW